MGLELLLGFCTVAIIVIGISGAAINLVSDNAGNGIVFLFLTFFIGMPLINIGYDYQDYSLSRQTYCTKYYNNDVNKYKQCINSDLSEVIIKGLKVVNND